MLTQTIKDVAGAEFANTVRFRRHLHTHPERSFHEAESARYIRSILDEADVAYTPAGEHGTVARIKGDRPGPCIAFRADFDALSINEQSDVEFASQNPGVMHACGHDGHAAVLLSLARTMRAHRELIAGEVVFIFQYAEELPPGGAKPMIEAGCLQGVERIYGLHVSDELETGVVGICHGKYMAASDAYFVDILGGGGHGSRPNEMNDTISAAVEAIQLSNNVISRFVSSATSAVVSTCLIRGGETYNVIPSDVHYEGTVRTYEQETAQLIQEKLELAVKSSCAMYGTDYRFRFETGYPAVVNHERECGVVETAAEKLGLPCKQIPPTPVGEDFSRYLELIPGAFFRVGIHNAALNAVYPLHHDRFRIDEAGLRTGLEMFWGVYLCETGQL